MERIGKGAVELDAHGLKPVNRGRSFPGLHLEKLPVVSCSLYGRVAEKALHVAQVKVGIIGDSRICLHFGACNNEGACAKHG